jgi:beta-lactamase regulating signal transducer with metallopeptidase domain
MLVVLWIYIIRPISKTANLLNNIQSAKTTLPSFLRKILKELGITTSQVILYKSYKPSVFCAGFCKPKIYISSKLINQLNKNELTAVLVHEVQHLRSYDPLRTFFLSIFDKLFFFVPLVKELSKRIRLNQETIADNFAVNFVGKQAYLKTIVKVDKINFSQPILESTGFENLLNKRVKHLLGKSAKLNKKRFVLNFLANSTIFLVLIFISSLPIFPKTSIVNHAHTNNMCKITYFHDCCIS